MLLFFSGFPFHLRCAASYSKDTGRESWHSSARPRHICISRRPNGCYLVLREEGISPFQKEVLMFTTLAIDPRKSPFGPKLLLVIEPDQTLGGILVQTIRKETPYKVILAISIEDAYHILQHLKCDLVLLADSLLPVGEEFSTCLNTLPEYEKIAVYFFPDVVLRRKSHLTKEARSFELDRLLQTIHHLLNGSGNAV